MVEVTPGFKAGVMATAVGLGVGRGVVAVIEKKTHHFFIIYCNKQKLKF